MARLTRKGAQSLLQHPDRFLYVTLGEEPSWAINGAGTVPRKIADELTGSLFLKMPVQRKGEVALVPQGDGLFEGMSQTWRAEKS